MLISAFTHDKLKGRHQKNINYLLTYSMEQSPSWEANWSAASQEIPGILWNPKVHHCTHKRTPPVSVDMPACCVIPLLETLPPGDPSGGVMYCLQKKHLAYVFRNKGFLWRGVVSTSPNPQAGRPPHVGCPRLLIQYICNYSPNWRLFLHPQPTMLLLGSLFQPAATWSIWYFAACLVDYMAPEG
jgi:hypothetical protein